MEPSVVENHSPLPPSRGVHADGGPLWRDLKLRLKSALSVLEAGRFTEIRPGVNDYDHCFREWWYDSVAMRDGTVVFKTCSADPDATRLGILKYRTRLEGLVRVIYALVGGREVQFLVRETEDLKPAA